MLLVHLFSPSLLLPLCVRILCIYVCVYMYMIGMIAFSKMELFVELSIRL